MLLDPKIPLFDMLLPRRCLVCQADILQEIICDSCESLCHSCPNPTFGSAASIYGALFYYEFAIKEIITRAKFSKSIPMVHLMLKLAHHQLVKSDLLPQILAFAPTAVTFVPAHWAKRLTHSIHLPLLFAHTIAKKINVPVVNMLVKNNYSFTQSSITRKTQRLRDIKGVFSVKSDVKSYKRIILVDDIVTSGATFDETRKMLQTMGSKLRCVAMAKTP